MRRLLPLLAAVALVATACGDDAASDGEGPIHIGFIESLTGNYAPLGTEAAKTVELAIDQINKEGGIDGRKIELTTLDDKTAPDQAVVHFNKLKADGVDAIIGSTFSNCALAVEPLAEREQIPYISLAPADEQVDPIQPHTFVVPATSSKYAESMLRYFEAEGITKIAVAYDTKSAYAVAGYEGMEKFASEYGVELVQTERYETNASDFSSVFTHVRNSDAEALAVWASGAPGVTLAKQYAAAGLDIPLVMTASQASELWLEPVGDAAEDVYVQSAVGVVGDELPDGKLKDVIDKMADPFEKKYGYEPPQFAMDGYAGAQLIAAAFEKAGGTDKAEVRDALESMDLVTPTGRYTYSAKDHSGLDVVNISMNQVQDGKLVPTEWGRKQLAEAAEAAG
jgi:branched-chain amino acid transport system substrate-binding protein